MELSYNEKMVLIRVLNRYLEDYPNGESAPESRKLLERLKAETGV